MSWSAGPTGRVLAAARSRRPRSWNERPSPRPIVCAGEPVPASAQALLATAELGPLDDLRQAGLERLRAQLVFSLRRGNHAP
ncbi:hypothetical protein ACXC9Q_17250 [Kribbella sp. CWNU-51]